MNWVPSCLPKHGSNSSTCSSLQRSAIYCLWPSASQLYVRCRRWISSLLFATLSRLVHDSFTIEHKLIQRVWLNKGGTEEDHVKLSHTPLATITKSHIMSRWQNYGMFTWKKWNHGMERKVKFSAPGLCIFLVGWTEKFIYTKQINLDYLHSILIKLMWDLWDNATVVYTSISCILIG